MTFQKVLIRGLLFIAAQRYIAEGCECVPMEFPPVTSGTQGQLLVNCSFSTLSVNTLHVCATRCLRQRKCRSFNYDTTARMCALNNETRATAPDRFKVTSNLNLLHYDIRHWSESLLGGCANHACADEDVCSPGYFGQGRETYICLSTYPGDVIAAEPTYDPCTVSTSCTDCVPVLELGLRKFGPVGCYFSGATNALATLVQNLRGTIDWNNITSTIVQCAELAQGYSLFGIEFYGECWGGSDATAQFSNGLVALSECDTSCPFGVGAADVMMVYRWL